MPSVCTPAGLHANVVYTKPAKRLCACRSTLTLRSPTKDQVYVATTPLIGWEAWETTLQHRFPDALARHCMVLVKTHTTTDVTVFDFLPVTPTAPATAARLLSGTSVQGNLRERKLSKLPNRRCWLVGEATQLAVSRVATDICDTWQFDCAPLSTCSSSLQAVEAARQFNTSYDSQLRLARNDCRNHSAALVRHLTGHSLTFNRKGTPLMN